MSALDWLASPCGNSPQALVVVAHPDDEIAGAGARLAELRGSIVHLTDGAPRDPWFAARAGCGSREAYAALRRRELDAAMALAGVAASRLVALGAIDQEAAFELERLTRAVEELLARERPRFVLTHAYEGGHPDHDAAAFVVRHAIARARAAVEVIELAGYHEQDSAIAAGRFLPAPGAQAPLEVCLDGAAQARKRRLLDCFASQREVLARFSVEVERYRRAPRYRFDEPPHAGRLHYERFGWPLDGERWRALARDAALALGHDSPRAGSRARSRSRSRSSQR